MTPDELVDQFGQIGAESLLPLVNLMANDEHRHELTTAITNDGNGVAIVSSLFDHDQAMGEAATLAAHRSFSFMAFDTAALRPALWRLSTVLVAMPQVTEIATQITSRNLGEVAYKLARRIGYPIFEVLADAPPTHEGFVDLFTHPDVDAKFDSRLQTAEGEPLLALRNPDVMTTLTSCLADSAGLGHVIERIRSIGSNATVGREVQEDDYENAAAIIAAISSGLAIAGIVTVIAALDVDDAPDLDLHDVQTLLAKPRASPSSVAKRMDVPTWHFWHFMRKHGITKMTPTVPKDKPKPAPQRQYKIQPRPTPTLKVAHGATPEQLDHNDQTPLITALDTWFDILRDRLQAPIPRKPAADFYLKNLAKEIGVELPPDVLALYRYSNGAWKDDRTPLGDVFLPDGGAFSHIPSSPPKWWPISIVRQWHGIPMNGDAFDDLPPQDFVKEVPVFHFDDGHQLSVMNSPAAYQAVAVFGADGMHWAGRRIADIINNAIKWEQLGLIDWRPLRISIDENYQLKPAYRIPANPDHFEAVEGYDYTHMQAYQGWIWEPAP